MSFRPTKRLSRCSPPRLSAVRCPSFPRARTARSSSASAPSAAFAFPPAWSFPRCGRLPPRWRAARAARPGRSNPTFARSARTSPCANQDGQNRVLAEGLGAGGLILDNAALLRLLAALLPVGVGAADNFGSLSWERLDASGLTAAQLDEKDLAWAEIDAGQLPENR